MPTPTSAGSTPGTTGATATPTPGAPPLAAALACALPTLDAPAPPSSFVPRLDLRGLGGYLPRVAELTVVAGMLSYLSRFANYADVLGQAMPLLPTVQTKLDASLRWRKSRALAEAWRHYATTENALSWKETTTLLDELKLRFRLAMTKDVRLATT